MKVINNIDKVFKQITGRAEIALKAAAIHAESAVTAVTPVDHGNLRRSNSHRIEKKTAKLWPKSEIRPSMRLLSTMGPGNLPRMVKDGLEDGHTRTRRENGISQWGTSHSPLSKRH